MNYALVCVSFFFSFCIVIIGREKRKEKKVSAELMLPDILVKTLFDSHS